MLEGALNKVWRICSTPSFILSLLISFSCSGKQTPGHSGQNRGRGIEHGEDGKFDLN